jgi:hypothetical protein
LTIEVGDLQKSKAEDVKLDNHITEVNTQNGKNDVRFYDIKAEARALKEDTQKDFTDIRSDLTALIEKKQAKTDFSTLKELVDEIDDLQKTHEIRINGNENRSKKNKEMTDSHHTKIDSLEKDVSSLETKVTDNHNLFEKHDANTDVHGKLEASKLVINANATKALAEKLEKEMAGMKKNVTRNTEDT